MGRIGGFAKAIGVEEKCENVMDIERAIDNLEDLEVQILVLENRENSRRKNCIECEFCTSFYTNIYRNRGGGKLTNFPPIITN